MKTQYLDLPLGTVEYVVIVPTEMPTGVDPSILIAEGCVVARGVAASGWVAADWLTDPGGWGMLVDTGTLGVGEFDVRVRFVYGDESPLLGPVRLRVTV